MKRRGGHAGVERAYVIGAGFSYYAGVPLQRDFTEALLKPRDHEDHVDHECVRYLCRFVEEAFDHKVGANAKWWPSLEDIFTCIDMSANTGHHLGKALEPARLRTVRRAFIAQIFRMLHRSLSKAQRERGPMWKILEQFFKSVDLTNSAFVSTNWDAVVESFAAKARAVKSFEYGCDAIHGALLVSKKAISEVNLETSAAVRIAKVHGSVNWLYCDNCRQVFWLNPEETPKVAGQLLSPTELESIDGVERRPEEPWSWLCSRCGAHPLGTRLSTFSYLKALGFPMFQKSWFGAERILKEANKWVFIGYSLPAADFEFKYLLKRLQLAKERPPEILVVTGGDGADETYLNYERFFGRCVSRKKTFFGDGLTSAIVRRIVS